MRERRVSAIPSLQALREITTSPATVLPRAAARRQRPIPIPTAHGPIHLTLRLVGLKGGGRQSHRDTDTDSTSDSDSASHNRRKKSRERTSKGELTQALRAMTSLAECVAGICRFI